MACLEDSQIHTSAAILILHCERNLGRVKRHAGGNAGGPVEEDRRRSSEIVGDCELDDIACWVRRRMWAKVLFDLFVCLVVSRNSIAVLLGHLLLFSLSSFHVHVFQMEG